MKKISVDQFHNELKKRGEAQAAQAQCLDVREPAEYGQIRLDGFESLPLSGLSPSATAPLDKFKPTYLLCRSGGRACQAAERLEKMGFTDLRVIEGGLSAFEAAGKPVIRGDSKVWGLERQVRFAAGFLVLSGILLAHYVYVPAIFLSAFVAAGLIFSAVTDTCGMAMLLARMPWNKVRQR